METSKYYESLLISHCIQWVIVQIFLAFSMYKFQSSIDLQDNYTDLLDLSVYLQHIRTPTTTSTNITTIMVVPLLQREHLA